MSGRISRSAMFPLGGGGVRNRVVNAVNGWTTLCRLDNFIVFINQIPMSQSCVKQIPIEETPQMDQECQVEQQP